MSSRGRLYSASSVVYPDCWDEVDDNWSALPDLNRSPVLRSPFSYRRRDLHSVWKIFVKEKNGTVKQLLTLLSDVKQ